VHSSVAPAFYAKLKERAAAIRVGDPLQPGCRLGPVVSEAQYKRVMSYVQVGGRGRAGERAGARRWGLAEPAAQPA
jgi:betaine-aldehyde dehydrogenase